ncbi:MAG: alpha/beta hydrolase [Candidatus Competibacteraceae bacterium]|nr:alpha/beta hydrolase [Candidatus Competibacteraceae bacterium]
MSQNVRRHSFEIRAAGRRLRAERLSPAGALSGPTLVFLHEGLGSIGQWRRFPAELCALTGLPGLLYERWGFGHSEGLDRPRPDDYLEREARESLPQVLAACAIADPPILFGHSDGASIALLFAAAYPQGARAVISESAHVFIEEVCLSGIGVARDAYEQGELRKGLERYHGANTETLFRGWCDTWLRPSRRHWNVEAELPRIVCPTLIVQGEDDEYATRAQVDAIAAGVSGPTRILWLPDCAHVPHHQAREKMLDSSAQFIEQLSF